MQYLHASEPVTFSLLLLLLLVSFSSFLHFLFSVYVPMDIVVSFKVASWRSLLFNRGEVNASADVYKISELKFKRIMYGR